MTNERLNILLAILDKYEINLDITPEELLMLSDDLVDKLEGLDFKVEIITTLHEEISRLKNNIEQDQLAKENFPAMK